MCSSIETKLFQVPLFGEQCFVLLLKNDFEFIRSYLKKIHLILFRVGKSIILILFLAIHKDDKHKIKLLLRQLIPDLFFSPRQEMSDDEDEG